MNFSNKIIVFLLGLSLGLLCGASFFIFKIDDYISKMELFKSAPDTTIILTQNSGNNQQKEHSGKEYVQTTKTDNTKDNSIQTPSDSLANSQMPDSLLQDSTIGKYTPSTDEIIVKKDELILAKTIDVTTVSGSEVKTAKDSILQKESGIRDDSKNLVTAYQVEFWQSPINYKGYKMLKNKIVLFGVALGDNLKLYKIEDALYLKQQQNVYRLNLTSDFKQFESVKDASVLAKIK